MFFLYCILQDIKILFKNFVLRNTDIQNHYSMVDYSIFLYVPWQLIHELKCKSMLFNQPGKYFQIREHIWTVKYIYIYHKFTAFLTCSRHRCLPGRFDQRIRSIEHSFSFYLSSQLKIIPTSYWLFSWIFFFNPGKIF